MWRMLTKLYNGIEECVGNGLFCALSFWTFQRSWICRPYFKINQWIRMNNLYVNKNPLHLLHLLFTILLDDLKNHNGLFCGTSVNALQVNVWWWNSKSREKTDHIMNWWWRYPEMSATWMTSIMFCFFLFGLLFCCMILKISLVFFFLLFW